MGQQIPLSRKSRAFDPVADGCRGDGTHEIAPDLAYRALAIVNVIFYGKFGSGDRKWVLIDTGIVGTNSLIIQAAAARFGKNARPAAIILTHGHFDHVGGVKRLAQEWAVPIYAHELELPYLTGRASYPPADPQVGGGLMALSSPLFSRGPIDVSGLIEALPSNGDVPGMGGWRWLHTPGHTPGHVSLWREADRALIAGDAFITTHQESAYGALMQTPELRGPPAYFTPDWEKSRQSVEKLAALRPELVVTGHGEAMRGPEMQEALSRLAREFREIAVPKSGRYAAYPARAEDGSIYRHP
jgi:glyoxylase-like metal-dependent hydrolase (beta-lactamase superfamily II)